MKIKTKGFFLKYAYHECYHKLFITSKDIEPFDDFRASTVV